MDVGNVESTGSEKGATSGRGLVVVSIVLWAIADGR